MRTGVVRTYVHINTYMRTNECVVFLLFFVVCFVPRPDSRFWEGWLCYVRVVFCFFVYGTYENGEHVEDVCCRSSWKCKDRCVFLFRTSRCLHHFLLEYMLHAIGVQAYRSNFLSSIQYPRRFFEMNPGVLSYVFYEPLPTRYPLLSVCVCVFFFFFSARLLGGRGNLRLWW